MSAGAEVMIGQGGAMFQHGRVVSEDTRSFTIPFSHVQLRGKKGNLLKTRFAFVPSKYLVPYDTAPMLAAALKVAAQELGENSPQYKRILRSLEVTNEA